MQANFGIGPLVSRGREQAMRCKSILKATMLGLSGGVLAMTVLWAQEGPGAPWRGAGPQPCFGAEGGSFQCRQSPGLIAVRAGRLFDSKTGQILIDQVVLILNERITAIGAATQVQIPADAQVIDLSR